MENRTIYLAVALLIFIIAGMFGYAYMASTSPAPTIPPEDAITDAVNLYSDITTISAKQFYENGEHTLVGSILMPTPCEVIDSTVQVAESFPEQVMIAFTVVNTAEMCAQVMTEHRFLVRFSASDEASIAATFQGRSVTLNLIPALPGETPDTVELFFKG